MSIESCYEHKFEAVDSTIDLTVQQIITRAGVTAISDMVNVQRAWYAFRKADCQSQSDYYEGGSAAVDLDAACDLQDSKNRLIQLREQLSQQRQG